MSVATAPNSRAASPVLSPFTSSLSSGSSWETISDSGSSSSLSGLRSRPSIPEAPSLIFDDSTSSNSDSTSIMSLDFFTGGAGNRPLPIPVAMSTTPPLTADNLALHVIANALHPNGQPSDARERMNVERDDPWSPIKVNFGETSQQRLSQLKRELNDIDEVLNRPARLH